MSLYAKFGRWLAVLVGPLLLASCVVESGPLPPDDGPRACTMEYDPVCARRFGERRTFSNSCAADAAGYDVIRRGECRRDGGGGGGGGEEPRFCTEQYDPVCARRGGQRQTFANACKADVAGYRVISQGECRGGGGVGGGNDDDDDDDGPRACTREYAPVCARRGDRIRTFGNACTAEADGYRVISDGEC
jgi:hypothetical protein